MNPTILYDYQIFESQRFGGISRYFVELMKRQKKFLLPLLDSQNDYLKELSYSEIVNISKKFDDKFLSSFSFKGKKTLLKLYKNYFYNSKNNKKLSASALSDGDFDIFHPTYFNPYFFKHLAHKPYVITVHDMIHELFPQYFKFDYAAKYKRKVCDHADAIIAVSNSTKNDLLKLYSIDPLKVSVVYHGSSMADIKSQPLIKKLTTPYILFVGSRKGYKNFSNFIQGIRPVLNQYAEINVVCAGERFTNHEFNQLRDSGLMNRFVAISVNDYQLKYLYENALCFVFPSLYEGFGIPIIESMSSGCIPILSNTSSFPEIGGEAALYFDPNKPEEITFQVTKIIEDTELRNSLLEKGQVRSNLFSWDKCSAETNEVYQSLG